MKNLLNIKSKLAILSLGILAACNPIEDRDILENAFDKNNIELEYYQESEGSNKITLQLKTKGVAGYWDYLIGKKNTDKVEFVVPFTGDLEFTFHTTTPYIHGNLDSLEYVTKSITVPVTKIDNPIDSAYYKLVGANLEGKEWVFDTDATHFWTMTDPGNFEGIWWNPANDGVAPYDLTGKMKFDLTGAANYTHILADGTSSKALFSFNDTFTSISIVGNAKMLGIDGASPVISTFQIIELTDDKLTLFGVGAQGWVWRFKAVN